MKALAFIDLLGFSQMVSSNQNRAKIILNDFYNISYRHIKNETEIQGDLFSDSLMAHSENPATLVNTIAKIYRECLMKNNDYDFPLNKYFLLPRGGISFGHVDIQSRLESPNLTKNFIISPALVHSAKMESQIKGSRLLIADTENNNEQIFNWNGDIKSILYENSSFTFWSTFKYFDALWFLDLSKGVEQQKEEVTNLISISEKLVQANNRDNYYWLIWLTLIEMIMNSPDNWALPSKIEVIDFYKNVSLKTGWSSVIKEINKPRNEYLLGTFQDFISEINI